METNTKRPERRTAFVARELKRFDSDIVAFSETRRAEEGQLREEQGNYTFFWKGKAQDQPRIHGVGFAVRNDLLTKLTEKPVEINGRLMTLRIGLERNQNATVISAYAPTLDAEEEVREAFYADLDELISATPNQDKLIILGDFNARVGRDHNIWEVRKSDQQDVLTTKAVTAAHECWSDHRLISSVMRWKVKLKARSKCHNKQQNRKYNVTGQQDEECIQKLVKKLKEYAPEEFPTDVTEHWEQLKSVIKKKHAMRCECVVRMENNTLPKQMFYSELTEGKRAVGGQKKRFKDEVKGHLNQCAIDTKELENLAMNRTIWSKAIRDGVEKFE
ncbi:Craniofacial development protein 2 [Stylophora pistillata]|uniref:Craniofacial development protein 2 n=1 Tax=Stylophora pistillata TaxID=50429 RepID=A0A2B4SKH3_STYPI|nr:Craniofacial development protein 2 [Stylophora pistillata]